MKPVRFFCALLACVLTLGCLAFCAGAGERHGAETSIAVSAGAPVMCAPSVKCELPDAAGAQSPECAVLYGVSGAQDFSVSMRSTALDTDAHACRRLFCLLCRMTAGDPDGL